VILFLYVLTEPQPVFVGERVGTGAVFFVSSTAQKFSKSLYIDVAFSQQTKSQKKGLKQKAKLRVLLPFFSVRCINNVFFVVFHVYCVCFLKTISQKKILFDEVQAHTCHVLFFFFFKKTTLLKLGTFL
jgi:hypothetical protein